VLATKRGQSVDQVAALEAVLDEFLDLHDPVRRADRAMKRQKTQNTKANSSREDKKRRQPKTATEIHAVNARDRGRCQFVDAGGKRCENDRWIHHHHKTTVSLGGDNDPENMISLCSFHHDLIHQLSFGIDGQVNWIGEPGRADRSSAPVTPLHVDTERRAAY